MPKVAVYNMQGAAVSEMELPDEIFNVEVNESLLHDVVVMYQANQRVGTAATKTRAEVRGGGRKPWRQKGTGRARIGSLRSPLRRGGGIVFGPQPRDYSYTMPKKARRLALKSALSAKLRDGELVVIDELNLDRPRTRDIAAMLENLNINDKALIVTASPDENVVKSARNIEGVGTSYATGLNVYDILTHDKMVMTRDAVLKMGEVLSDA